MGEDVQKLCKALGGVDELQDGPDDNSDLTAVTMTVLQSVQKLIADNLRRDRDSAHLLTTMNDLAAALDEDMKNAEMRNAYKSVLGVIERQRRDQERMLRALANGESPSYLPCGHERSRRDQRAEYDFRLSPRLRPSNSGLKKSIVCSERQLLERQIADLIAFYSKQKQTALVSDLMIE
ncbi:hypothetical protein EDB89DRAFT_74278 [Lactarius sanguifluus]|nr:hypothetical protein EDB89DRAFT_74278 [Lactarius sanguifluus]